MGTRVFIGRLPSRATERDIEHFFRGNGRIREVVVKTGFGFVEFEDPRDAEDAVYERNGRDLCGDRVVVEMSRRRGGGGGGGDYRGSRGGYGDRNGSGSRYGPPMQTRYRLIVENLSTRCSWQDLKDMMRGAGEPTYADAHKKTRNEGIVCFATRDDMRRAIDKYQGKEINGRRIKLIDDSGDDGGRGRSRSRSPRGRRGGGGESRSRSPLSRSPRSRSRKSSRSSSPKSRSRSPPERKSASRSRSPANGSRSPAENGN